MENCMIEEPPPFVGQFDGEEGAYPELACPRCNAVGDVAELPSYWFPYPEGEREATGETHLECGNCGWRSDETQY
jgi:uncharacterized C2H2 Zn-finger protein